MIKLTEGTFEVLAEPAIDWRPEGEYPINDPYDVLMAELDDKFRYDNVKAVVQSFRFCRSSVNGPRLLTSCFGG